jgi:drug/metabolite transporter (DMT)-like permease
LTVGSTLSLKYLRSDWVAPLGSTSLVFNFIFAKILVGIEVTKEDVRGTALIVLGVLCILIFSSINHGLDAVITVDRYVFAPKLTG